MDAWQKIEAGPWAIADELCGGAGYTIHGDCRNPNCRDGLLPVNQWRKVSETEMQRIEKERYGLHM